MKALASALQAEGIEVTVVLDKFIGPRNKRLSFSKAEASLRPDIDVQQVRRLNRSADARLFRMACTNTDWMVSKENYEELSDLAAMPDNRVLFIYLKNSVIEIEAL
ncbi:Rossmann-fold NAD(P)-binding domain-containing protein [Cellvibrio polysaccharolyticus]|uniref:hypothetical protein n=1 Tax=Cellvibrio polysaccharolyticus TaxID=2082724 RepID=UPI0018817D98|nr:hypothetical protein [Cellvibrio polysaccharolyticus]